MTQKVLVSDWGSIPYLTTIKKFNLNKKRNLKKQIENMKALAMQKLKKISKRVIKGNL
ncbi:MAG: hypothetical protein Q8749_02080 [Candidatus Phytoplasma australasiaticum]|nr:hypothetical protein [Candidatus Phytoplasma australasiaticum]MDV3175285.1 hypothetical protein [Candidatus Phytoplasma australasiaticum]